MKTLTGTLLFALLLSARGQSILPKTVSARSHSGQFIVFGIPPDAVASPATRGLTNTTLAQLEPGLLAISSERIKQALMRELDAQDQWRGNIYLVLRPARSADETIVVTSTRFADAWHYRMELPDVVDSSRLVRAVVQTLLLEMANRSADESSAEIPAWLGEGMVEHLLAVSEVDLVLQPPRWTVNNVVVSPTFRETRRLDPLARAKDVLRDRMPLSLEELSWPKREQLAGDAGAVFRGSAQLFVQELLRLRYGRNCMYTFISQLPRHLNWQTAFLRAYQPHFERQLDLEKWWALQSVHFTGRGLASTWPAEQSWRKFDEIIRSSVQVRLGTNDVPLRSDVGLQTIIKEWDYARQTRALQAKIQQLQFLRLRVAPELVPLVNAYCRVLQTYVDKTAQAGAILRGRIEMRPGAKRVVQETLNQLDKLDLQRDILRPIKPAPAQVDSATAP